jgi:hypothetical protein
MGRNSAPLLCVKAGVLGERTAALYDALGVGWEVFRRALDKREVREAEPFRHWRWNRNGSLKLAPYRFSSYAENECLTRKQ